MNRTKNLITTFVISFFVLFAPMNTVVAQSFFNAALPDAGDRLQVFNPAADSYLKGTTNISIIIVDDDATSVEYTVGLYDSANCSNLVGNISSGNDEGNINVSWNTKTTQSTSNLQDGEYCLKVCTVLQNDEGSLYSACNGRRINVLNNNTKPIITSTLSQQNFTSGENFSYQVTATDAENDTLKYRLVSAPEFLTINPNTGLVTSTSSLTTKGAFGLQYSVTVGVSDNKSGEAFQTIKFNVYAQDPTNTPPVTNNEVGTNVDNTPETTDDNPVDANITDFEFIGLGEDTVVEDFIVKLQWTYGDSKDDVSSATLQFSGDGVNWNELASGISPDETSYDWDVSELPSGEYFVRLIIENTDSSKQVEESDPFVINSQKDGENTNEALIISVSPESNGKTEKLRPTISGQLLPSNDSSISVNTFKLLLDGRDISDSCEVSDDDIFECTVDRDLDTGRHVVSVSFMDEAGNTAEKEWTFSVVETSVDSGTVSEDDTGGLSQSAILFILLIVGLGLVVLVVPWILYTLWARGNSSKTKTTTQSTYNVTTSAPEVQNDSVDPYSNFDYQYPDININTEYAQPESVSTENYIQPYDVNAAVNDAPVQDTMATQQPSSTDGYLQPYDDGGTQDFVEPEQTS